MRGHLGRGTASGGRGRGRHPSGHAPARRQRSGCAAGAGGPARRAGHRGHHGPRRRRCGGKSPARRCLGFSHEAGAGARCGRDPEPCAGGPGQAALAPGPGTGAGSGGGERPGHAGGAGPAGTGGAQRRQRPAAGRDRRGQGAVRPHPVPQQPPGLAAFRGRGLRLPAGNAGGEPSVRPCPGGLHRRGAGQRGPVAGGASGHALPGRGGRSAAGHTEGFFAGAGAAPLPSCGRGARGGERFPPGGGHQSGSGGHERGRALPQGSALPPAGHDHRDPAPAPAPGRDPPAGTAGGHPLLPPQRHGGEGAFPPAAGDAGRIRLAGQCARAVPYAGAGLSGGGTGVPAVARAPRHRPARGRGPQPGREGTRGGRRARRQGGLSPAGRSRGL